eukprot:TRINITY_DN42676_c0_g1_i1.p1 TRINITY_DN42676_c0_g1~~TRINITY_DN42676_c0_g1_i1.p1  ORF type:complete len:454 (+),score=77.91 TRINITY_DN42676_c0_g1_i1:66-1364(+)
MSGLRAVRGQAARRTSQGECTEALYPQPPPSGQRDQGAAAAQRRGSTGWRARLEEAAGYARTSADSGCGLPGLPPEVLREVLLFVPGRPALLNAALGCGERAVDICRRCRVLRRVLSRRAWDGSARVERTHALPAPAGCELVAAVPIPHSAGEDCAAALSRNGTVLWWDGLGGPSAPPQRHATRGTGPMRGLASCGGKGVVAGTHRGELFYCEPGQAAALSRPVHLDSVWCVGTISTEAPGGAVVVSGAEDGYLCVTRLRGGAWLSAPNCYPVARRGGQIDAVMTVCGAPHGCAAACGDSSGWLRLVDCETGAQVCSTRAGPGRSWASAWHGAATVCASWDKHLVSWDTRSGGCTAVGQLADWVLCAAVQGDKVACGGENGELCVWDARGGGARPLLRLTAEGPVRGMALTDHYLLTVHEDATARCWDEAAA